VVVSAFTDPVHEVERRSTTFERSSTRRLLRDVTLDPLEPSMAAAGVRRISRQTSNLPTLRGKRASDRATYEAGGSGQKQAWLGGIARRPHE